MMFNESFYRHPYFALVSGSGDTGTLNPDALDDRMRQTFEIYIAQFAAIDPEGYVIPRSDVLGALATVAGVAPKLAGLRKVIARDAPTFAMKLIDELQDLTLAIAFAQGRYEQSDGNHDALTAAVSAATRVRQSFLTWLEALADKGFADDQQLTAIRRGSGHVDLANDVEALTAMLRAVWPTVGARTLLDGSEFANADTVVAQLRATIEQQAKADAGVAEIGRVRQAAITTLTRRWDEVRRVATYVRWREDDVDQFAPSLWARGKTGKRPVTPQKDEQGGKKERSPEFGGGKNALGNGAAGGESGVAEEAQRKLRDVTNPEAVGGGVRPITFAAAGPSAWGAVEEKRARDASRGAP